MLIRRIILPIRPKLHQWTCYVGLPLGLASIGESRQIHCEQCTLMLGPNRPQGWLEE